MLLFFKMFSTLERSVISKDTSTDACSDRFISAKSPVTRDCVFNTCNILDNISYIQNYLMSISCPRTENPDIKTFLYSNFLFHILNKRMLSFYL